METVKKSVVARFTGREKKMDGSQRMLRAVKLFSMTRPWWTDTCHISVQMHRMYNIKSESKHRLLTLGDDDM